MHAGAFKQKRSSLFPYPSDRILLFILLILQELSSSLFFFLSVLIWWGLSLVYIKTRDALRMFFDFSWGLIELTGWERKKHPFAWSLSPFLGNHTANGWVPSKVAKNISSHFPNSQCIPKYQMVFLESISLCLIWQCFCIMLNYI